MRLLKFLKIPAVLLTTTTLMFFASLTPALGNVASAASTKVTPIDSGGLPKPGADASDVHKIVAIVFGIVGALALLMIVISGLRYVLSAGDPQRISKAKDGILYALVGLAIALAAEAIVAFVGNSL